MTFALLAFFGVLAAVGAAALLLVAGALGAAALLPRGSPVADRLRSFAADVPRLGLRAVCLLDGVVFVGAIVLAVLVTLAYS